MKKTARSAERFGITKALLAVFVVACIAIASFIGYLFVDSTLAINAGGRNDNTATVTTSDFNYKNTSTSSEISHINDTTITSTSSSSSSSAIQTAETSPSSTIAQLSTITSTISSQSSTGSGSPPAGFWLYIASFATNAPFQGANVTVTPVLKVNGANVTLTNEQASFTTNATGWIIVNNMPLTNFGSDFYLSFSVQASGWRPDYPEWNFSETFDAYWQPQKITLLSILLPYTTVGTWYIAAPPVATSTATNNSWSGPPLFRHTQLLVLK